ncbi:tripartite motif-containing protein 15-like isoform X2 [Falco peregrinus]|uniref:tripartite motif-containing protein 15-like isoform X2 n=1 Tax=Falco peregrinus TaxID=8954 RepID=UPI002479187A|nr:tripartite motif-containing protein 15-like isoform X2 [Falco peregrinus]
MPPELGLAPSAVYLSPTVASVPIGNWPMWWQPSRSWQCRRQRSFASGTTNPSPFFSRRDGRLLCTTCAEHRAHPAVPLEEAACWYRDQFEASLKALQEEDERRAGLAAAAEETRQEMLSRVDAEKQKLLAVLEGLRRVLGEQESRFLIRLGRLRLRLEEQRRGEAAEMARLQQRRSELQAKCRQPDSDLLRDAQITLSRHRGVLTGGRLRGIPESNRDAGPGYSSPPKSWCQQTAGPQDAGNPPWLLFPREPSVSSLSAAFWVCRASRGGRHRWAVEVRPGPDWALGVAREFMSRKGCFGLSPERGVWAVGQWLGQLRALTWPSPTSLPHSRVPRRIEVALDYAGGRVAFRDADSETEIFAFPPATFAGERLRPLLWLGEGPALLTLCP